MNNIAVIYKSNYGTTEKYATWIAEELGADLFKRNQVSAEHLLKYDGIIYGGGLYASGILGVNLVTKNPVKNLVIFTVGLASPEETDYTEILDKNLPSDLQRKTKVFHLRGGINYKDLGLLHRGMMAMMNKMVQKKSKEELTDENKAFLETYGGAVDFTNRTSITTLVDYVSRNWM